MHRWWHGAEVLNYVCRVIEKYSVYFDFVKEVDERNPYIIINIKYNKAYW